MAAVSAVPAVSTVSVVSGMFDVATTNSAVRATTTFNGPIFFTLDTGRSLSNSHRGQRSPSAACAARSTLSSLATAASSRSARKASHTVVAAAAAGTTQAATEEVPVPVVVIDNHSEANATVVQLEFGDRLGALMDTMAALRSLGLNVVKGRVTTVGTVARNTFTITQEGGKVESAEMIEAIRGTIIANLLKYHPESGTQLAMGLTCDSPPCNASVPTRMALTPLPDNSGSELRVEAADRPGLLMEIVDVLTGMSVSVTSAEIDTEGMVAKDVFTVSYHGGPLDDEMTTVR
ncbi:unnamed protein product [Closterium sp. Yama58-4]|nr:unnamed protein product [Closterium sp. Yama58-4]